MMILNFIDCIEALLTPFHCNDSSLRCQCMSCMPNGRNVGSSIKHLILRIARSGSGSLIFAKNSHKGLLSDFLSGKTSLHPLLHHVICTLHSRQASPYSDVLSKVPTSSSDSAAGELL